MEAVIETTLAITKNTVNTVQEANLQRFTPQEIDDFCGVLEIGAELMPKTTAAMALQIIRQLQSAAIE